MMDYELLDCGNEKKLERFGPFSLIRPAPQAIWNPQNPQLWKEAHGEFQREKGNQWKKKAFPSSWNISFHSLQFKLTPTDFGHLGLFPEHAQHWDWMLKALPNPSKVLNLFAYSGAATLALAQAGHSVCHLDASKGMVEWARENAALNHLTKAPIRWIVDDAVKFLKREVKRASHYDAILLDPPTFGRGSQGQVFKIERDILPLLELCRSVLSSSPAFILLTAHTPGFTPLIMEQLLSHTLPKGKIESGEMTLPGKMILPTGTFAHWRPHV